MFAQKVTYKPIAFVMQPFAVDRKKYLVPELRNLRSNSRKRTRNTALHQGTRLSNPEANHPVDVPAPHRFCVLRKKLAGFETYAIVVHPKKSRVRMRDIDRN